LRKKTEILHQVADLDTRAKSENGDRQRRYAMEDRRQNGDGERQHEYDGATQ
jgi:hypothetical protein